MWHRQVILQEYVVAIQEEGNTLTMGALIMLGKPLWPSDQPQKTQNQQLKLGQQIDTHHD